MAKNENIFERYYQGVNKEFIDRQDRAFRAALAYEKNCIIKYDYLDNRPSRPPKNGDTMSDYANRYGTTTQEMKNQWSQVEVALEKGL